MKHITILFLCLITIAGCGTSPVPSKTILQNGLTVIVKEENNSPLVCVSAFIKSGQLYEESEQAGISSFVSNLLLKGTKNRSAKQLADEVESLGASISSGSSPDYSEVSILSLQKHFEHDLEILADVLMTANFPANEIEKERAQILAAIKGRYDDPFNQVYDQTLENLYPQHPYGWTNLGKPEIVKNLSRPALMSYYQDRFKASNIILSVAGGIKKEAAIKTIKKYFAGLKTEAANPFTLRSQIFSRSKEEQIKKQTSSAWLAMGFLTDAAGSASYPALKVLHSILGSGMGSRLFVELREKQALAYSLGTFLPTRADKSHFIIYASCSPENVGKLKVGIEKEIDKLLALRSQERSDGEGGRNLEIKKEELDENIQQLSGEYVMAHQGVKSKSWYLGWYEAMGLGYAFDEKYPELLKKVSAAEVQNAARKYLRDPVSTVLTPN